MRPIFDERGPGLDRFGVLLLVTIASVSMQSLVDLRYSQTSTWQFAALTLTSTFAAGSLLLAMRASGVARRLRSPIAVLVLVGLVGSVVTYAVGGDPGAAELSPPPILILALSFLSPLLVCRRILRHDVVGLRTVLGAIAAYLLIAVLLFYVLLTMAWFLDDPLFGSTEPTTSFMYFSLTTITTLGYGDLTPVAAPPRFASVAVAVLGQVFLVVFVAMIVSRFDWGRGRPDDGEASS